MNAINQKSSRLKFFALALMVTLFTTSVHAAEIKVGLKFMNTIIDTLTGVWGTTFAVLMVALVGFGALLGKINVKFGVSVAVGILIIWSAGYLVSLIQGA